MESAASYSLDEPQDAVGFVSRVLDEALETEEETSLEAKISSVSMKLQIMSADLSEEIERCMSELLEASLRAGGEASQIVRLLDGVSEEAKGLAGRASRQLESGDEAETLAELETTRANMSAVQVILCASNEWEALCSEVKQQADAFLGSKHVDIEECRVVTDMIAQRLMPAERALKEVPGAETRKRFLETVIEDVETALRPIVASAIRDDATLLKELVGIYDQLDLSESLRRDYASARPAALHRRWFARPRSADNALLGPWLRSFLDDALDLVAREITHCREVFGAEAARKVAAMTARAIFAPLASSFAERLEHCREVEDVAACRDMCMSFAHHVQLETGCSDADYDQVAMAVAGQPFDHVDYAALEMQHLVRRATVVCGSNDDVGAVLANAKSTLQALFSTELTAVASRCLILTGGLGGIGFGGVRDAAAIAFGRSLCLSLETLRGRYVRDDLPLDTSLLSDCWARAKQAFGAISLAGKLETTLADRSASGGHAIREWCEVLLDDDEQPSSTFAVRYARQLLRRDKRIKLQIENLLATGAAQSPLDKVKLEKCLDELNAAANSLVFELAFSPIRAALRRLSSKRLHDNAHPISYCRPAVFCGGQPADHPNEYVTVVGNHLLAALHELEPFLASDAVRDVIHRCSVLSTYDMIFFQLSNDINIL